MTEDYWLADPLLILYIRTYKFPSCPNLLARMYSLLQFRFGAYMYSNRCLGSSVLSDVLLYIHVQVLSGLRLSCCSGYGTFREHIRL